MVGLPTKNNKEYPLFDYERILFNRLFVNEPNPEYSFKNKHLWCKKSTGLGVSEFMLRIMGWLCTSTDLYHKSNSQMVIVTGPNQDLAIKLIKRLKAIFERKLGLTFNNKETVLELNGVEIQAYPSSNIDSFRSLTNPKFILLDESDFWIRDEVDEVRDVVERYIGKSDPYIAMVSTPNAPNGLFDKIEREPEDTCLYKRVKLDYTYGLGKIYTEAEIENAKHSPSFKREYQLFYLGLEGNIFTVSQVNAALELGEKYKHLPINSYCIHSIGIDPGFSSSPTGIVATEFLKEESKIRIVYAEQFEKSDPQYLVNLIFNLYHKYGHLNTSIYVDGSNRAFVNLLKVAFNESLNWEKSMIKPNPNNMNIIPVSFNSEHKEMLSHLAMLVSKEYLCIPKQFDKMEIALRTAYADEYSLNKEKSSYNDLTDSLRLACKQYKMK
jgi:hypothetical protein